MGSISYLGVEADGHGDCSNCEGVAWRIFPNESNLSSNFTTFNRFQSENSFKIAPKMNLPIFSL